jgi:hypothetical protein
VPRSKWVTLPIKFGKLQTYEHISNWFEVQVPNNWTKNDKSTDDSAIVTFTDPTKNGAVFFNVFANTDALSKDDMAEKLDEFVRSSFKNQAKFKAGEARAMQKLNGASQVFSYETKLSNNKNVVMYGDAYYEQHDNTLISIIVLLLPQEQYETVKKQVYEIVDSFSAKPENYAPEPLPEPTPEPTDEFDFGALTDYEHPTGVFTLRVPEDWTERDSSKEGFPLLIWADSTGQGVLSVSATKLQKAYKSSEIQATVVSFINGYAKGNKRMKNLVLGAKRAVGSNAALARFTFTAQIAGENVEMSGVALAKQNTRTIAYLILTYPTNSEEANSELIGEILDSVGVDGKALF